MNKKISAIIMALVIAMVGIPLAIAEQTGTATGTVNVLDCTVTTGINVTTTSISFGSLIPGATSLSKQLIFRPIASVKPECGITLPDVNVTIEASDWIGSTNTQDNPVVMKQLGDLPTSLDGQVPHFGTYTKTPLPPNIDVTENLNVTIPASQPIPDSYTQVITITAY